MVILMSTDKFDRGFNKLTTDYVLSRLEHIDELLACATNGNRIQYLEEQRAWWERELRVVRRRESAALGEWARSESANLQKK